MILGRSAFCALGLAAITAVLVACGGNGDASPTPTARPAATNTPSASPTAVPAATTPAGQTGATRVEIGDFSYSPSSLTARTGQQVSLNVVNGGNLPHTFTIDGVVDSGSLNGGQSRTVSFTPAQAGTLTFYCAIHGRATMSGTLTVSATGGQTQPPPPPVSGSGTGGAASPPPTPPATDYGY